MNNSSTYIGHKVGSNIKLLISHLFLTVFSLIIVYPLFWMIMQSFKKTSEMYTNSWGLPKHLNFDNYGLAWSRSNIGQYFTNSVFVTFVTVLSILVVASLASYAFSKFTFPGNRLIFYIFVMSLMLPVPIIPLYSVVSRLGIINTFLALILPYVAGGLPMSIFLLKPFFDSIPREIEESAKMDGCSSIMIFIRIITPLSKPGLATVTIFQFMGAWNEFMLALIFIRNPKLKTIPVGLQAFFSENSTKWAELFAALCIATIPIIIVYAIMQKQFIEGLTAGAIKG